MSKNDLLLAVFQAFMPSQDELKAITLETNKRYFCQLVNLAGIQITPDTIPSGIEITDKPDPKGIEKLADQYIEYKRGQGDPRN